MVKISKQNCEQFCTYAADFVSGASESGKIEIEYRVAVDEDVFQQVCQALESVESVLKIYTNYTVVHFPSNVRVVRQESWVKKRTGEEKDVGQGEGDVVGQGEGEEGSRTLLVQRKQTLLRLCVGTIGLSPLRGVVAVEQAVEEGKDRETLITAVKHLLNSGINFEDARADPPLPTEWLRTHLPKLEWVAVGKGKSKRFLQKPTLIGGKHLAFGRIVAPALDFVLPEKQKKAFVPVHVRKCWRQTFQWDDRFKIDCTIMHQGAERVVHHIEVECCGDEAIPFPLQLGDLLTRVCSRKKC